MRYESAAATAHFHGFAQFVGGDYSGGDVLSRNLEGHEVYGLVGDARFFGDFHKSVPDVLYAEVGKAHGQSDFQAEADDFFDLFHRSILENELADGAERDLFAVEVFMSLFQHGQTVVDGMRRGKTAGLESQTRKQDVGFDDILERGSNDVGFAGEHRFVAVGKQRLIAQFRQRVSGLGAHGEQFALGAVGSAGQTGVDVAEGLFVGSGFEISGERVAHTRNEESDGSVRDNGGVDQNNAGALFEVSVVVESAVRRVQNRGVRSGSVGRRDGGAYNERITFGNALCGVYGFAAAETDGAGALVFLGDLLESGNFLTGTFAGEVDLDKLDFVLCGGGVEFGLNARRVVFMRYQQRSFAESLDKVTEVQKFVFALNVLGGANKCFSHYEISFLLSFLLISKVTVELL